MIRNPNRLADISSEDYAESTEENYCIEADSYELLQSVPLSQGGHFVFSSEKKWNEDIPDNFGKTSYFNLNVKFLNQAISTIPLHKILDTANIQFSREEKERMERKTVALETNFTNNFMSIQGYPSKPPAVKVNIDEPAQTKTTEDNELDDLLGMTSNKLNITPTSPTKSVSIVTPPRSSEVVQTTDNSDIQNWLDNVLEE